jgi:hypothetical protein
MIMIRARIDTLSSTPWMRHDLNRPSRSLLKVSWAHPESAKWPKKPLRGENGPKNRHSSGISAEQVLTLWAVFA